MIPPSPHGYLNLGGKSSFKAKKHVEPWEWNFGDDSGKIFQDTSISVRIAHVPVGNGWTTAREGKHVSYCTAISTGYLSHAVVQGSFEISSIQLEAMTGIGNVCSFPSGDALLPKRLVFGCLHSIPYLFISSALVKTSTSILLLIPSPISDLNPSTVCPLSPRICRPYQTPPCWKVESRS